MMFYQRGLWPFGALSWSGNSQISVNTKVWASFLYLYFLMGHSRPHFLYFRLFNTVDSKIMLNINFADDWIQTATHWYWKQLLYQLSHNHCLIHLSFSVGWSNPKRLRISTDRWNGLMSTWEISFQASCIFIHLFNAVDSS